MDKRLLPQIAAAAVVATIVSGAITSSEMFGAQIMRPDGGFQYENKERVIGAPPADRQFPQGNVPTGRNGSEHPEYIGPPMRQTQGGAQRPSNEAIHEGPALQRKEGLEGQSGQNSGTSGGFQSPPAQKMFNGPSGNGPAQNGSINNSGVWNSPAMNGGASNSPGMNGGAWNSPGMNEAGFNGLSGTNGAPQGSSQESGQSSNFLKKLERELKKAERTLTVLQNRYTITEAQLARATNENKKTALQQKRDGLEGRIGDLEDQIALLKIERDAETEAE